VNAYGYNASLCKELYYLLRQHEHSYIMHGALEVKSI